MTHAVVGGLLLGFLDFVWIKLVPFPLGDLGNSSAVWAVAAVAFGYWVRRDRVRAASGAAVLLVVAVPSYHFAAALIQGDDFANMWGVMSLVWMLFGILAGVVSVSLVCGPGPGAGATSPAPQCQARSCSPRR